MAIFGAVHESLREMVEGLDVQDRQKTVFLLDGLFLFKSRTGAEVLTRMKEHGITCNIVASGRGKTLERVPFEDDSRIKEMWRKHYFFDHQGKEIATTWYPDPAAEDIEFKRLVKQQGLPLEDDSTFCWARCIAGPALTSENLGAAKRFQLWKTLSE